MIQEPKPSVPWSVIALVSVFGIAVTIPIVDIVVSRVAAPYAALSIFFGAFLIGSVGAAVYVVVQAITDPTLAVFQNIMQRKIDKRSVVLIFIMSGGVVAGISTLAAGSLTMGNSWTVFLLGFGWQGAIAGVGGGAAVSQKAKEADDNARETEDKKETALKIIDAMNRESERKFQDIKRVSELEKTG